MSHQRTHFNLSLTTLLFLLVGAIPFLAAHPQSANTGAGLMDWWRDARFGMFIHWGIYSVPADGEWYMNDAHVPVGEYEKYALKFDPTQFDADTWASIAHDAGMKYLVITSKHHDGFSMFRTSATKYNVVDATPWGKDPLKELSEACRRHGIKFCVYYSIMDWHSPYQEADRPDSIHPTYNPTHFKPGEKDKYISYMKTQLSELINQYHPAVLWFDGGWMNGWTSKDGIGIYEFLKGLDPELIVNNRIGGAGDYETPEQVIPPNGIPGEDWETCMTINNNWGYNATDTSFKSARTLIRNLVDIASKGGNYLLNVGPTDLGVIPQPEVDRLEAMGRWLRENGSAIYGTTASPFSSQYDWGRCTGKDKCLYLTVFDRPADGIIQLVGLYSRPTEAYVQTDSEKSPLKLSVNADTTSIAVPSAGGDPIAYVVVLKFPEKPVVYNPPSIGSANDIFIDTLNVEFLSPEAGSEIRYTEDGTVPVVSSRLAAGPVTLSGSATITAACFRDGREVSGVSSHSFTKVVPLPATESTSSKPGIECSYFVGNWNAVPDFTTLDPVWKSVEKNYGLPSRHASENYGLSFSGFIDIPGTGVYKFATASDDGSKLFIDGRPVVDNDGLHGLQEKSGVVALVKGIHSIKVDFFQASGSDELHVYWTCPGKTEETIPDSDLFH